MHPSFRHHMEGRNGGESLRLRVSSQEKTELETMLMIEGGNLTELLVEGIWRVIASRESPPGETTSRIARPQQPKSEAINFRLVNVETVMLTAITSVESCSIVDLAGEGIWHVINDRKQDPYYQAGAERILALLAELGTARANLHHRNL